MECCFTLVIMLPVALAEHISGSEEKFVKLMNKRAKEFGIKNTKFVDVTGLGNNISTAKDVAIMFELALEKIAKLKIYQVNLHIKIV